MNRQLPKKPAPPKALPPRRGEEHPWKYGAYRIVVTRRVTEEEQISVELYEATLDQAITGYERVMTTMRRAMIAHNEQVVMTHQDRLVKLERQIEHRAQELQELEEELEQKKKANGEDDDAPDAG